MILNVNVDQLTYQMTHDQEQGVILIIDSAFVKTVEKAERWLTREFMSFGL